MSLFLWFFYLKKNKNEDQPTTLINLISIKSSLNINTNLVIKLLNILVFFLRNSIFEILFAFFFIQKKWKQKTSLFIFYLNFLFTLSLDIYLKERGKKYIFILYLYWLFFNDSNKMGNKFFCRYFKQILKWLEDNVSV